MNTEEAKHILYNYVESIHNYGFIVYRFCTNNRVDEYDVKDTTICSLSIGMPCDYMPFIYNAHIMVCLIMIKGIYGIDIEAYNMPVEGTAHSFSRGDFMFVSLCDPDSYKKVDDFISKYKSDIQGGSA